MAWRQGGGYTAPSHQPPPHWFQYYGMPPWGQGGGGRRNRQGRQHEARPAAPVAWTCPTCSTEMNNPRCKACRVCSTLKPGTAPPAEQVTPKAKPREEAAKQRQPKGETPKRGEDGIAKADVDWFIELREKKKLAKAAAASSGGSASTCATSAAGNNAASKEVQQIKDTIAQLQLMGENAPTELIRDQQNRLNRLTANKTTAADKRDSAKVHNMLSTLERTNANTSEAAAKEMKAAQEALEAAQKRVEKAKKAQEVLAQNFSRKQKMLKEMIEELGGHAQPPQTAAVDPRALQTLMSEMIQEVREEEHLVGQETAELKAVAHFCTKLIHKAAVSPTAPTTTEPPDVAIVLPTPPPAAGFQGGTMEMDTSSLLTEVWGAGPEELPLPTDPGGVDADLWDDGGDPFSYA